MEWYKEEDIKYSKLYSEGYPIGDPFRVIRLFEYLPDLKVLDLGCGRAPLARHFNDYTGVDISSYIIEENKKKYPNKKFHHQSIDKLDCLYNEEFDLIISADVMEHIPEEEIHNVLTEIRKLKAKKIAFSISTRPSVFLDHNKKNLHLTIWNSDHWIDEIEKLFVVNKKKEQGSVLIVELI